MIHNTVKTIKKADEILAEKGSVYFFPETANCECGESRSVEGFDNNFNYIGKVVICPNCGNDDAFIEDVFYKETK